MQNKRFHFLSFTKGTLIPMCLICLVVCKTEPICIWILGRKEKLWVFFVEFATIKKSENNRFLFRINWLFSVVFIQRTSVLTLFQFTYQLREGKASNQVAGVKAFKSGSISRLVFGFKKRINKPQHLDHSSQTNLKVLSDIFNVKEKEMRWEKTRQYWKEPWCVLFFLNDQIRNLPVALSLFIFFSYLDRF